MSRDICQDLCIFFNLIRPEMVGSLHHCYVIMLLFRKMSFFHYRTSYAVFLQLLLYR